jgi:[calcium/calmodulin-dependent protein kinase] kinase
LLSYTLQNLLVSEDGIVKIADYSISRMLRTSDQTLSNAAFTPPEVCVVEGAFSGQLADVWALGATMFTLKFEHPPYAASNITLLYNKIRNDPLVFPYQIDSGLQDLLENMMVKDVLKRYTLNAVATHPWLQVRPAENTDSSINASTSMFSMTGTQTSQL